MLPCGRPFFWKIVFFLYLLLSSKRQNILIWLDLSLGSMLELLVLKKYAECTSRHVKWTSGARDMTISFPQLSGPTFLKLPDFNIVFSTISFRKASGPNVFKTRRGQYFLNKSGSKHKCYSITTEGGIFERSVEFTTKNHNSGSRSPFDMPTSAFCIFFQN